MWYLSSDDIQCLNIGCGILGSGGGGDPATFKTLAIDEWNEGKLLKVYHPKRLVNWDFMGKGGVTERWVPYYSIAYQGRKCPSIQTTGNSSHY